MLFQLSSNMLFVFVVVFCSLKVSDIAILLQKFQQNCCHLEYVAGYKQLKSYFSKCEVMVYLDGALTMVPVTLENCTSLVVSSFHIN